MIIDKFFEAIKILRPDTDMVWETPIETEEDFNEVQWVTGSNENNQAIKTTTNPHSEITWDLVEAEMIRLQADYDAQDYARKREAEYPSIQDCVHAILDDDLENLQILRQAVKDKFPKENS